MPLRSLYIEAHDALHRTSVLRARDAAEITPTGCVATHGTEAPAQAVPPTGGEIGGAEYFDRAFAG